MTNKQKTKASKFLSLLLRHKPEVGNLTLDANGWAHTKNVLKALNDHGHNVTLTILKEIVEQDEKQRYAFSSFYECIRANQGHSVEVDLGLVPIQPPEFLFHGTAEKSLGLIYHSGLLPMSRQHVHLSGDIETALKVGKRHGDPVVLIIRADDMFTQGHEFYQSENGVWLTAHVPLQYFYRLTPPTSC